MSASSIEQSASPLPIFIDERAAGQSQACHYKISTLVRHLLDVLTGLCDSPRRSLWALRHLSHWKGRVFLNKLSLSSDFIEKAPSSAFAELLEKYKSWKELSGDREARKELKAYMRKGFCYASCLRLLNLQKESVETRLEDLLPEFENNLDSLIYDQILELFRNVFETNDDKDSLAKVQEVLPQPENKIKILNSFFPTEQLAQAIQDHDDQVLFLHVWKQGGSHVVTLRTCPEKNFYYFYNSSGRGLYSFSSQEELITALASHIGTHVSFSRRDASWEIENYPIK